MTFRSLKILVLATVCCLLDLPTLAQTDSGKNYRNFPVLVTIQFHSLSLPFSDMKTNFSNIGIGLGTEVSHNGKHNWVQQFSVVWFRNREVGNGLLFYTQPVWRPTLGAAVFTEAKIGVGYLISQRPSESYQQVGGEWVSVGRKGKGMITIPAGFSLGYHAYSTGTYLSPYASYQLLLLTNYNPSIPLLPETLIQMGTRIHPNFK